MTEDIPASALAEAVEDCSFPVAEFRHRQHVQLGWYYLRTLPLLDAVTRFGCVIARFAAHHGAHGKYDEPLTVAYMLLIEERRRATPDADWPAFAAANDDVLRDGQGLVKRRLAAAQSPNTRSALPARNSASASSSSPSSSS